MARISVTEEMQRQRLSWALANGVTSDMPEARKGQVSRLLEEQHRERNLFDPRWRRCIAGHERRWMRAPNSSQRFAVTVFAPPHVEPPRDF